MLELCESVVVLSDGRVVEEGDPQVLIKDPTTFLARLGMEEKTGKDEEAVVEQDVVQTDGHM